MEEKRRRRRKRRGRKQSKRRRARNLILRMCILFILIVSIIVGFFVWKKYSPTKEQADLNKYYGITNENQLAVVVNNSILSPTAILADGKAYVEYSVVHDYINERFYWNANDSLLLYTLPNDVVSVEVGSQDYSVSKEKNTADYVILKTEGSTAYVALDFVKQYTDMDFEVYDNPSRVVINTETGSVKVSETKKKTQVRYQGGVKSPILTELDKNEEVRVLGEEGSWKKVLSKNGCIGYVPKSALRDEEDKQIDRGFTEPEYTSISKDYTINMAWCNITAAEANSVMLEQLAATKGLTTVSPTWFHVTDTSGNITSIASLDCVNYAHQAGIEVWAAVRDFDGGINSEEQSLELLSHTANRENLENQLITAALNSGIDGINVDFEKISLDCGEHYIQFIRELSVKCRQNGLVLSVDNYVPQAYNEHYNRKEQGVFADYVVIMGYDEHYAGSPEAGSVASYNFVQSGIEATIEDVPASKVINAMPFYTRIWKETPKTDAEIAAQAGTDSEGYTMNVTSEAYSMGEASTIVANAGVTPTWDDTTQQYYATWEADGYTYETWLEDYYSIEARLQLMKTYELAGTAAWRLGQEQSEIWDLIAQYVN